LSRHKALQFAKQQRIIHCQLVSADVKHCHTAKQQARIVCSLAGELGDFEARVSGILSQAPGAAQAEAVAFKSQHACYRSVVPPFQRTHDD
jgi:hypothetical protein